MGIAEITHPRRFADCRMNAGEVFQLGPGTACIFSARAPDRAGPNEDAAALIPLGADAALLAVADGAGGHPDGAHASTTVIELLIERIVAAPGDTADHAGIILAAIEEANGRLVDEGSNAATTLALVEIRATEIRPYHVGDSLILISGNRGKVKLETLSHSPVAYAVESGLMSENEAIIHEERHLVSNIVGSRNMHVSVGSRTILSPRDSLLLATDGLSDNLQKEEIVDRMRKGPLRSCAQSLIRLAEERMQGKQAPSKPDDMTFILFRPGRTGTRQ